MTEVPPQRRKLRLVRTHWLALRSWWDYLGLCAAVSALSVLLAAVPLSIGGILMRIAGQNLLAGILVVSLSVVWAHVVWCACCRFARVVVDRDEPVFAQFAFALKDPHVLASALLQALVWLVIVANALFYGALPGIAGFVARMLCLYAGILWAAAQMYQAPMLALADADKFEQTTPMRDAIRGVRNSLVVVARRPLYSMGLLVTLLPCVVVLTLSGAGLVFVLPMWAAIVCTTATRSILVDLGYLSPPPDPDAPIVDAPWKLRL